MSKWDAVEDKITEGEGKSKKWVVVLCIVIGIVGACGLFYVLVVPTVNDYLSTNYRMVDNIILYDFYDLKVGENQTAVYFIGSSIIQNGIAPSEINRILREEGYEISTYDLGISGDRTELRTLQLDKIIESKPSLVVYGISYITLSYETWINEYTFDNRIHLDFDGYSLYSSDELRRILVTSKTPLKYSMYLESAINKKKSSTPESIKNEADRLVKGAWTRITGEGETFPESYTKNVWRMSEIENPNNPWRAEIGKEATNREIDALYYNINKLQEVGIPVVVVNMPLNPLLSEKISDTTRENYFTVLDKSGAKWYDFEYLYGDEYFTDSHHMFSTAAMKYFSPIMADVIIQEFS